MEIINTPKTNHIRIY